MFYNKEEAQEIFRGKVLEAMDEASREIFGCYATRNDAGATDEDLTRLFPALDIQLEVVAQRFNQVLLEDQEYNQYLLSR